MAPDRRALIAKDWEREPPRDRRDGPESGRTADVVVWIETPDR